MIEKNLSTTYVPLQAPYQIIKYGKEIGMQIGTLIATKEVKGDEKHPFRIETHSYPVVSYENKNTALLDKNLFGHCFMEGVVWNHVELRDVSTICLSNSRLSWAEYVNFLWRDLERTGYDALPQLNSLNFLHLLGVDVSLLPDGIHVLHLQKCFGEPKLMVRTLENDPLPLSAVLNEDDLKETAENLYNQILNFHTAFYLNNDKNTWKRWSVTFTPYDDDMQLLANLLNKRFEEDEKRKTAHGMFKVTAIDPYDMDKVD